MKQFTCQQCGYTEQKESVFNYEICPKCGGNFFPDGYEPPVDWEAQATQAFNDLKDLLTQIMQSRKSSIGGMDNTLNPQFNRSTIETLYDKYKGNVQDSSPHNSVEDVPPEKDCVTISELQEIATRHGYTHIVMLSIKPGNFQFVATFGETIEQSDQAAQMGNRLKDLLGWPERLHSTPSRVQELVDKIKKYESILKSHNLDGEAGIQ